MRRFSGQLCTFGAMLLAGCSINPPLELEDITAPGEGRRQLAAPFFAQTEYQCGPAALAGILGASGVNATPEALSAQVYLPERKGSLQLELVAATRRAGRIAYVVDPQPEALLAEIDSGRPVLVLQNLRTRHFPVWHYAVLTGFDAGENEMVLNSGVEEGMNMSARKFLRTWDWGGRWGMVALAPGELPARADALKFADAVAAFEGTAGGPAAVPAWEAMAAQWPGDYRPHLSLGNIAYKAGDFAAAMDHYRQGLEASPGSPVLENNLATVMAESGCPGAAETRLRAFYRGLHPDSPWRPDIEATLRELALFSPQGDPAGPGASAGPPPGTPAPRCALPAPVREAQARRQGRVQE